MTELSGRRVTADAVVVNYNAGEALTGCVESLLSAGVDRVFVVDNCSTDGSLEALDESVSVITTGSNRGYGSAANVGVAAATSDLVLVCNPDLVVDVQAVGLLEASLRADTGLAVVAPRLLTPEGETYPSARGFPRLVDALGHAFVGLVKPDNPYTRRYKRLDTDPDLAGEVDWVSGACFLARRDAFCAIGGFDEAYFMYVEDVDLCWRLREAGWRVRYEPDARVTHVQGLSTARHPYKMILAHHRSLFRFAGRTANGRRKAILPVIAAGLIVRAALACAEHAFRGLRGSRTPSGHD